MGLKGLDDTKRAIRKRRKAANESLRGVYLQGLGNIAAGTPVDEGRARNNWFLSVSKPFDGVTSLTSGNRSEEYRMPDWVIGKRVYFTNNLPYIVPLEYGGYMGVGPKTVEAAGGIYSDQAPGGWVRKELLVMRAAIRSIK